MQGEQKGEHMPVVTTNYHPAADQSRSSESNKRFNIGLGPHGCTRLGLLGCVLMPVGDHCKRFVLSKHSSELGRLKPVNVSGVICPTTEERVLYHPQLYNCFAAQSWQDKE